MDNKVPSWGLVPKPRSTIKTVEWFPSLVQLESGLWNEKNEKNEYPLRREYLKLAHPFEEYSEEDPEVNARMEFARYQTLGLAFLSEAEEERSKRIVITKAGRDLALSENKEEIILRQLLKLQFPSNIHSSQRYESLRVFPLEIMLHVLDKFKKVNRLEIAFSIFTCTSVQDINSVFEKIELFRSLVADKPANQHRKIFLENFERYNGNTGNQPETYLGNYDDVLFRLLEYTSLFETSGRGDFTTLFVPERSMIKFHQLLKKYTFTFYEQYKDSEKFYDYFGDTYATHLPWEQKSSLIEIVNYKLDLLKQKGHAYTVDKDISLLSQGDMKNLETKLDQKILSLNEEEYVLNLSKTEVERIKILEKFQEIDNARDNEDLPALWLEVNTWKSLVAMKGTHYVKRNFKVELDLTPRSFAKGTNSTPDMELYNQKYIIIPEVSIQSGVRQWVTEGSAVVEHVLKFMDIKNGKKFPGYEEVEKHMNSDNIKAVYGFFLCRKINSRLLWQMYILNKAAWVGEPVSIVPMEIKTYIDILEYMYKHDVPAIAFEELIAELANSAKQSEDYTKWQVDQDMLVSNFLTTSQ